VATEGGRIVAIETGFAAPAGAARVDLAGRFLCPGFVDLHVHGGAGADFMDATAAAFESVCRAHARHGTTALTPTSTIASRDRTLAFLRLCRELRGAATGGARIVGAHLYGPFFAPAAAGCHPVNCHAPPSSADVREFLGAAGDSLRSVTIAPEIDGAAEFYRAFQGAGVRCNIGHSHATFEQVEAAIGWGARHVDHLFCAMSDRARLRQSQTYPMRGGVMEATLYFEELTTEVIADGRHLAPELLKLALKIKGPDRLALVTDAMRGLDMPDGEYWFGAEGEGERVRKQDGVGVTLDGKALASGVQGMDAGVRTMHRSAGVSLTEAVRMARLAPATMLGLEREIGGLAVGMRADLVVLDSQLQVERTYVGGELVWNPAQT
ncbi:MAG TPA: N-acetylglucosamine-6-phosphate deacetylase, partial [Planctomycetia bacterium]|nr:N-acetylglucosamine-6-phosphate deacetylase [Planctomycetia bacterium]